MRLIGLAVILALSLFVAPLAGEAQQAEKVYRLGILSPAALQDLGYIEGRNLLVERRFAMGKHEQLQALASALVQARMATTGEPMRSRAA